MSHHAHARPPPPRQPARRLCCKTCGNEACEFLPIEGTSERVWLKCDNCGHTRTVAAPQNLDPEVRASAGRITDILQQLILTRPDLIKSLETAVREFLATEGWPAATSPQRASTLRKVPARVDDA